MKPSRASAGLVAAAVVLPPALWLGLDYDQLGDPLHASATAASATKGSAANASVPAVEVVRRAADAIMVRPLVLAGAGVVFAVRRRDRPVLSLAALALGWIAVVAIMAEVGFTGTRRYLAAPAAALCVVASMGLRCRCSTRSTSGAHAWRWRARSPCWRWCPRCCAPARTGAC